MVNIENARNTCPWLVRLNIFRLHLQITHVNAEHNLKLKASKMDGKAVNNTRNKLCK